MGSRSQARNFLASRSAVDVITAEQISNTGLTNLTDVMRYFLAKRLEQSSKLFFSHPNSGILHLKLNNYLLLGKLLSINRKFNFALFGKFHSVAAKI